MKPGGDSGGVTAATTARAMQLGDVIRFGSGKAIKPGGEGCYPVYGSNGIIGGCDEFRYENGVIIGRVGAYCGSVLYCPARFWASDNTLVAYPASDQFDTKFLFYMLTDAKLSRYAGGAAQPLVTQTVLKQVEVNIPPLPVQRRIAGILSAYDELMENRQRRIRILEAMARALYREWFVHFRFPGSDKLPSPRGRRAGDEGSQNEKLPLIATPLGDIPQGWETTTLGAHLSALESGKRPKGGIREEADGVPSIGAENINGIGQHDFAGEKLVPREFFKQMRKGVVRDRDVAIYKDGAYIGKSSYFRDGFPHSECCVNEHVFLLRGDGVRLMQNFVYIWLQEPETVQTIRSKNANAAQPGINQQTIGGMELILPDEKTAAYFDRLVEPLLADIINLAQRIQNLRRTRDLLLPRLLSGQISL